MNRRVITSQMHAGGKAPAPAVDGYFDKLHKYIPADINAAWVAVWGLLAGMSTPNRTLEWILFFVFIALTALWTWKRTTVAPEPVAKWQILIAALAFIAWVFALGGPFATFAWYTSTLGAIALILCTLIFPFFDPA